MLGNREHSIRDKKSVKANIHPEIHRAPPYGSDSIFMFNAHISRQKF